MRGGTVARLAVGLLVLALLTAGPAAVAQPRDYAYLFVQGRISDLDRGRAQIGATVRLIGEDGVYETLTDSRGAFAFEKLPIAGYTVEIALPDGTVLQGYQDEDPLDPSRVRIKMRARRGKRLPVRIEARAEAVAISAPEPQTNWNKLWGEAGIFTAAALLLAL